MNTHTPSQLFGPEDNFQLFSQEILNVIVLLPSLYIGVEIANAFALTVSLKHNAKNKIKIYFFIINLLFNY
jgi:hypothetical protein